LFRIPNSLQTSKPVKQINNFIQMYLLFTFNCKF